MPAKKTKPDMSSSEAVHHIRKVRHLMKVFEKAEEALETARHVEANIGNLTKEGNEIVRDLKELKNMKRTAEKEHETWLARAADARESHSVQISELHSKMSAELDKQKSQVDAEKAGMEKELKAAKELHKGVMAKMKEDEKDLHEKVVALERTFKTLVNKVKKFEAA